MLMRGYTLFEETFYEDNKDLIDFIRIKRFNNSNLEREKKFEKPTGSNGGKQNWLPQLDTISQDAKFRKKLNSPTYKMLLEVNEKFKSIGYRITPPPVLKVAKPKNDSESPNINNEFKLPLIENTLKLFREKKAPEIDHVTVASYQKNLLDSVVFDSEKDKLKLDIWLPSAVIDESDQSANEDHERASLKRYEPNPIVREFRNRNSDQKFQATRLKIEPILVGSQLNKNNEDEVSKKGVKKDRPKIYRSRTFHKQREVTSDLSHIENKKPEQIAASTSALDETKASEVIQQTTKNHPSIYPQTKLLPLNRTMSNLKKSDEVNKIKTFELQYDIFKEKSFLLSPIDVDKKNESNLDVVTKYRLFKTAYLGSQQNSNDSPSQQQTETRRDSLKQADSIITDHERLAKDCEKDVKKCNDDLPKPVPVATTKFKYSKSNKEIPSLKYTKNGNGTLSFNVTESMTQSNILVTLTNLTSTSTRNRANFMQYMQNKKDGVGYQLSESIAAVNNGKELATASVDKSQQSKSMQNVSKSKVFY